MMQTAKEALDKIIKKSRVHLYKPIQIAEILYADRVRQYKFDISDSNSYRNISKQWRDIVTQKLVGRVSTSSQKYQDNLFDPNAMPPHYLSVLADYNKKHSGVVEAYIYYRFKERQQDIIDAYNYLAESETGDFSLAEFLAYFEKKAGLKRSVDKAFEIVVYALFATLVKELNAQVTLSLLNPDKQILEDFNKFVSAVLGLKDGQTSKTVSAGLFRGGVTNAADRGLDIVTNYGPIVQVKHLSLSKPLAEEIIESVVVDDIVIVCKTGEADIIQSLLSQVGYGIRGIVTQLDLEVWYQLCQEKYAQQMGEQLLNNLKSEFVQEFPMLGQLEPFLKERGYVQQNLETPFII